MSTEHSKRIITAVIGVIGIALVYLLLGHLGLIILTAELSVLAYWEYLVMVKAPGTLTPFSLATGLILSVYLNIDDTLEIAAIGISICSIVIYTIFQIRQRSLAIEDTQKALVQIIFGLIYLVALPCFITRIHGLSDGATWLAFLFGLIWIGDISAYYGGKTLGKNKLAPTISPGKTLEGSLVALASCAIFAVIIQHFWIPYLGIPLAVLCAIVTSILAQAGDLFESLLKRASGVKDSGWLLPGHGGIFDRFDSVIFAAPFFYLFAYALLNQPN